MGKSGFLKSTLLGAVFAIASGLAPAMAATTTGTFAVTATVQAMCLISTNPLAFGTYTGAQVDATTTLSITCTNGTAYNVGLDAGTGSGATVTARKMTGPASSELNYALYQDAGRTTNWGNTVGVDTVTGSGSGNAQTLTVYGRLPSAQYTTPGGYTDTITATVTY